MFDLNKRYCYFFAEICKLPHGSGNEKPLSDWLVNFAKERGLSFLQDDALNVIIYKPASPGYETHPGIIIQAHMDMVCEKTPESTHCFETDPLELYVENGYLRARNTTLGADDGMGCAYMLAILDDASAKHPFLECCFTTGEEVGLIGAQKLKPEYFNARRLINLDGAGEYRTFVSMGGGERITLHRKALQQPNHDPAYRLEVNGLLGGHSGGMIDKERANAHQLMSRVFCRMAANKVPFRLVSMAGGGKPNVISARTEAVFSSPAPLATLEKAVANALAQFRDQYEFSDRGVNLVLEPWHDTPAEALSEEDSKQTVQLIRLLPQGQLARSLELSIPAASANLGIAGLQAGELELVLSIRSALDAWMYEMTEHIELLAQIYHATTESSARYPGWRYEPESKLREEMKVVFEELYGKPLLCPAGHGGNECGVFKRMHPDMDIVTSGAIYGNIHSTDEFLDLASFDRAYHFLTTFLTRL